MISIFISTVILSSFPAVKLLRVYDGDTFFITLPDVPSVFGENIGVRVKGIDTPEIKDPRKCMRKKALESKNILFALLSNKEIKLTHCERDKYFRLLCNVQISDGGYLVDVGSFMIDQSLAQPYAGQTKLKWVCS